MNCDHTVEPSALLTNTVEMPAAWARAAIATGSPPSLLGSCQIHMPVPVNAAGSVPAPAVGPGGFGGALTLMWMTFERRLRPSRTTTDTVPARVPAGTKTQYARPLVFMRVLIVPLGQRNEIRMPW